MPDFITWEFVGTLLGLFTGIETLRRHHNNKIEKIQTGADEDVKKITKDLHDYKLDVAKNYATKADVNAQFQSVSESIKDFGKRMEDRLDGMNERLDRVIENSSHKTASSRSRS
jgi:Skp family chaperone for outer membrane proteins